MILWNLPSGADFFDTVKPAKTKEMVVMKDPVNLKSSVEHMAFAKGAMRSQISQLSTRKKKREESKKQWRKDHIADIIGLLRDMGNPTLHSSSFDRGTSSNPHPEIKKYSEIHSPELEHTREIKAARRYWLTDWYRYSFMIPHFDFKRSIISTKD